MYNNALCTSLYNRWSRACKPTKPKQVARYAMMSIVWTLLLAALAFAVMQVPVSESAGAPARADGCEAASRVTSCARTALRPACSPAAACLSTAPQSCGTLLLHLHAARRRRASEPSKWRPWPATSWQGRVALRAPRRMSDTSSKVTFSQQCSGSPSRQTNTMHKHVSASTLVVQWSARPCCLHEIMSSNPEIIDNFANRFFNENMAYRALDIVYRGIY